jgi:hypothetical protein
MRVKIIIGSVLEPHNFFWFWAIPVFRSRISCKIKRIIWYVWDGSHFGNENDPTPCGSDSEGLIFIGKSLKINFFRIWRTSVGVLMAIWKDSHYPTLNRNSIRTRNAIPAPVLLLKFPLLFKQLLASCRRRSEYIWKMVLLVQSSRSQVDKKILFKIFFEILFAVLSKY